MARNEPELQEQVSSLRVLHTEGLLDEELKDVSCSQNTEIVGDTQQAEDGMLCMDYKHDENQETNGSLDFIRQNEPYFVLRRLPTEFTGSRSWKGADGEGKQVADCAQVGWGFCESQEGGF